MLKFHFSGGSHDYAENSKNTRSSKDNFATNIRTKLYSAHDFKEHTCEIAFCVKIQWFTQFFYFIFVYFIGYFRAILGLFSKVKWDVIAFFLLFLTIKNFYVQAILLYLQVFFSIVGFELDKILEKFYDFLAEW